MAEPKELIEKRTQVQSGWRGNDEMVKCRDCVNAKTFPKRHNEEFEPILCHSWGNMHACILNPDEERECSDYRKKGLISKFKKKIHDITMRIVYSGD